MGLVADSIYAAVKKALVGFGFVVRTSATSNLGSDPTISAGSTAPSEAEPAGSVYMRTDGTLYVRGAASWEEVLAAYGIRRVLVEVSPAELRALRATPKQLVAAPGAGKFIEPVAFHAWLDYGTTAHDAPVNANDDFTARYTNGSGAAVATWEATGFVNASSDQHRVCNATSGAPTSPAQYTPVANAALVLHNSGGAEFTGTGDSPIKVEVLYRVRTLEPTA